MPKLIVLNTEQESLLKEALAVDKMAGERLPMHINSDIMECNTILSDNPYIPSNATFLKELVINRISFINNVFGGELSNKSEEEIENKVNKLMSLCEEKEKNIIPQLEQICYDCVKETFNLTEDDLDFEGKLVTNLDNVSLNITPQTGSEVLSPELKQMLEKKILANTISVGFANYTVYHFLKQLKDELDNLEEGLSSLYLKTMLLNEYLVFIKDMQITDEDNKQGGCSEVELATENHVTSIKAKGVIFPILLYESIKAVMDILATFTLPENKKTAKQILDKADALENDIWYMRFGTQLWKDFVSENKFDTKILPYMLLMWYGKLNPTQSRDIFAHTQSGQECLDNLISIAQKRYEYSDFEKDITLKQEKQALLVDEINWDDDII